MGNAEGGVPQLKRFVHVFLTLTDAMAQDPHDADFPRSLDLLRKAIGKINFPTKAAAKFQLQQTASGRFSCKLQM